MRPPHQSKVLGREGVRGRDNLSSERFPSPGSPFLYHSKAEGFLDGGDPGADLVGRVLSEGVHDALPLGDGGNLLRVGPTDNGFLDFRRHGHHLKNTDPAQIASVPAMVAAFPAPEGRPFPILDSKKPEQGAGRIIGLGTMGAHFADKALGKRAEEHGRDEVRLDVHFHEPGDGAGRVVGVQGGQHEVPGEGRLYGDLCGFAVADLAHIITSGS